jgi:GDP-L-fucose synthase
MRIKKKDLIYVAGHTGLAGSAILRVLKKKGYSNILIPKKRIDFRNQIAVFNFIKKKKPKFIFIAAAKVGGIKTNNLNRADFIYDNLMIQCNIINAAYKNGINKLIFLGSNCVYPNNFKRPILESDLLTGPLEYTNEPYAIAKIAGIKLCENYNLQYSTHYLTLMPCNLYGVNDNYNLKTSHFFPALISKIFNSKKKIILWGSPYTKREIMYSDDLAEACVFFMEKIHKINDHIINIGSGYEKTIKQYADYIKNYLNNKNPIHFNNLLKGTRRKRLNINKAKRYGWFPKNNFNLYFKKTFLDFLKINRNI